MRLDEPVRAGAPARIEVQPPAARQRPWQRRIATWLSSSAAEAWASTSFGDRAATPRKAGALGAARAAFREALEDLEAPDVDVAREHLRAARSLHELWHLRTEVFSLIARHRSQGEAAGRIARVDRHFSTRSRPSVFAGKDGHESLPPL